MYVTVARSFGTVCEVTDAYIANSLTIIFLVLVLNSNQTRFASFICFDFVSDSWKMKKSKIYPRHYSFRLTHVSNASRGSFNFAKPHNQLDSCHLQHKLAFIHCKVINNWKWTGVQFFFSRFVHQQPANKSQLIKFTNWCNCGWWRRGFWIYGNFSHRLLLFDVFVLASVLKQHQSSEWVRIEKMKMCQLLIAQKCAICYVEKNSRGFEISSGVKSLTNFVFKYSRDGSDYSSLFEPLLPVQLHQAKDLKSKIFFRSICKNSFWNFRGPFLHLCIHVTFCHQSPLPHEPITSSPKLFALHNKDEAAQ